MIQIGPSPAQMWRAVKTVAAWPFESFERGVTVLIVLGLVYSVVGIVLVGAGV